MFAATAVVILFMVILASVLAVVLNGAPEERSTYELRTGRGNC